MFNQGLLSFFPVAITTLLFAYLGVKVIDFATGLMKTKVSTNTEDKYKSSKMRDGLIRWMAELCGIAFVMILDLLLGLNFLLCGLTLSLFLYKEGMSILENLLACGVELPTAVVKNLAVFNKSNEENEGEVK